MPDHVLRILPHASKQRRAHAVLETHAELRAFRERPLEAMEEVGLPFRRYMLWRKVARAILAIGQQRSMAAAAHEGDFADAAHLTRTFHQMFGIQPPVMMRGEFFEIPSPFAVSA